jgi:hypothetical protein
MKYLIGQETCSSCGARCIVVAREHGERGHLAAAGELMPCDDCGEVACRVDVWFPSLYWPEVEALVRFDDERQKLKLPPLTETLFQ